LVTCQIRQKTGPDQTLKHYAEPLSANDTTTITAATIIGSNCISISDTPHIRRSTDVLAQQEVLSKQIVGRRRSQRVKFAQYIYMNLHSTFTKNILQKVQNI
jgi:hypothetical protein